MEVVKEMSFSPWDYETGGVDKMEVDRAMKRAKALEDKRRYIPVSGGTILDSGERTVFETGAVRDMHEGKGRMDLLPLSAVIELSKHCEEGAKKYGEHNVDKGIPQHSLCDSAMRHLVKYMRGDSDENHLRAACWNLMWALEQSVNKPELNDLLWNKTEVLHGKV